MIILDTNVVSELMRAKPDGAVAAWLAARDPLRVTTTTITIAEIQRGIHRLPAGKRRKELEKSFAAFIDEGFRDQLLPFDRQAAFACGEVGAARERKGLHADPVDMMIAAIAKVAAATLATRNIGDFEACGVPLVNPWTEGA